MGQLAAGDVQNNETEPANDCSAVMSLMLEDVASSDLQFHSVHLTSRLPAFIIRYNTIDDLHWKNDRQAASLI